ncbi:MAG: hypothetical protein GEV07_29620 [Streptosporangiales bacterium]|nr:hypothetical protein [Streptosporangiales bacterium]
MAEIKENPGDGDTADGPDEAEDPAARVLAEEREQLAAEERERARAEEERAREEERERERARSAATRARTVRWATTIVSIGSAVFAIALALHIVFVVFDANPANPLVGLVAGLAEGLVVFFRDLFTPEDDRVGVLVNYGMAAIFWLLVGRALVALLRRIR